MSEEVENEAMSYQEAREYQLDKALEKYQNDMIEYRNAIASGAGILEKEKPLNDTIRLIQENNKTTEDKIDELLAKMEQNSDLPEHKEKTRHLRQLLADRQHELQYTDQRIREDIENDRWINHKIIFFKIVIVALILLMVYFLRKLYIRQSSITPAATPTVAPAPPPTPAPTA